jgi:hypothetical protein
MKGDVVVARSCMLLLCLLLPSCIKQQSNQQKKNPVVVSDDAQNFQDEIVLKEAMLVDVPIPLYDERIMLPSSDNAEDGTLVFGYKSPLSREQASDFFVMQMERLGWEHLVTFEGAELILQFESPDRYCTVIIKNSELSHSSIFIYLKKASV